MADYTLPANYSVADEGVRFDLGLAQHGGVRDTAATANLTVGTDYYVWTNHCIFVDLGRRINHHVTDDVGALGQKHLLFV